MSSRAINDSFNIPYIFRAFHKYEKSLRTYVTIGGINFK